MNSKNKYLSSAFLLLSTSVIVKIIGALYKIPLTAFIGAVGRGYFATAYNLYLPLHAIIMGALPIAMSRLVSKYSAKNDNKMLSSLRRGAGGVFFLIGAAGTGILFLFAKPYTSLIASSEKSVYTVFVIAPSLLFSCIAAYYRGFYEGFLDMKPTAVSQTLEALFKTVFGLLFSKFCMRYLYNVYIIKGTIFGVTAENESEALSLIYPLSSAAAMLGVTAGSVISLAFVFIYDRINRPALPSVSGREGRRALLSFSLPVLISCAIQSIFQFLDTATVQYSLKNAPGGALVSAFESAISLSHTQSGDVVTYIWGLFCTAMDFKNLIPGITMALGVCAVPAICREFESKNNEKTELLINSVFKYTAVISVFMSAAEYLLSKEILELFFASSSKDVVLGCDTLVKELALTAPLFSFASTAVFTVQALGKPEKSVLPYVVSGIIRCALNCILITDKDFLLLGAVISGGVGYGIMFIMNLYSIKRISKCKISLFSILIKPLFTGVLAYFSAEFINSRLFFEDFSKIKLLIHSTVFAVIYCILCFFFKVLDFKEIFSVFNFKKNGLNT